MVDDGVRACVSLSCVRFDFVKDDEGQGTSVGVIESVSDGLDFAVVGFADEVFTGEEFGVWDVGGLDELAGEGGLS